SEQVGHPTGVIDAAAQLLRAFAVVGGVDDLAAVPAADGASLDLAATERARDKVVIRGSAPLGSMVLGTPFGDRGGDQNQPAGSAGPRLGLDAGVAFRASHAPLFGAKRRPCALSSEAPLDIETEVQVPPPEWRAHVGRGDVLVGMGGVAVGQQDLEVMRA